MENPRHTHSCVLCPSMVVDQIQGQKVAFPLKLTSEPQNVTIDVVDLSSRRVAARALVSELQVSMVNGVMIEDGNQKPVAFLETKSATTSSGIAVNHNRLTRVWRIVNGGWDAAGPPFAVFFLNKTASGSKLVARLGGTGNFIGRHILSVNLDANRRVLTVTSEDEKVMAIPMPQEGLPHLLALNIACGVDAGLVLCAVFSLLKLSGSRSISQSS